MLENINIVFERKIKIDLIETLRKEKKRLKERKIAPITFIENDLLNETCISIKTFFALCSLHNLNIFYIHKKTYYEFVSNAGSMIQDVEDDADLEEEINEFPFHTLTKNETGYSYCLDTTTTDIKNYREKYYKIDSFDKPIKAFSAYNTDQLLELCNKLLIETDNATTNKKKNKKEMYEAIVQYF